jgi:hypothetical protein
MEEMRIYRIHRVGRAVCAMCAIMLGVPCLATAQAAAAPSPSSPGSREIPRPDQIEPGVSTTPAVPPAPAATETPAAAPAAPLTTAPSAASPAPAATAAPSAARSAATHKGPDRLELDATDITGNRELPKVLYIVPWKRSDLGDVVGRPVNSLLDEVLQPLDRDVFRRENRYYDALPPGGGDAKAGAAQGSQPKP